MMAAAIRARVARAERSREGGRDMTSRMTAAGFPERCRSTAAAPLDFGAQFFKMPKPL